MLFTTSDPGWSYGLYTTGVVFHVWEALPFNKAVWHGLVVAAAACHYCAVLYGVALAPAL